MIKSFSTTIFKLSITRRLIIDIFEAINEKTSFENFREKVKRAYLAIFFKKEN